MEEFLVDEIYKALLRNPNLRVTILLDNERSSREENGKNSIQMLSKLVKEVFILHFSIDISAFKICKACIFC
jgi:hypothetical protein